jgi:hypothetical protein
MKMIRFILLIFLISFQVLAQLKDAQDVININFSDGHGGKDIAGLLIDIQEQINDVKTQYAIRGEKPHIKVEFGGDIMAKSPFNSLQDDLGDSAIKMMLEIARDPDVDVHYTLGNHEGDFGVDQTRTNIKKFVEGIRKIKFEEQGNLAYKNFKISATNLRIDSKEMNKYIGKFMDYPIYNKTGTKQVGVRRVFGFQYGSEGSYFEKAPKLDHLKASQPNKFADEVKRVLNDIEVYNKKPKAGKQIVYVTFASHEGVEGIFNHGDIFYSGKGRQNGKYLVTPITSAHDHVETWRKIKGLEAEKIAGILDTGAYFQSYGLYGIDNKGNWVKKAKVIPGKTKYGDVSKLIKNGTLSDKSYIKAVTEVQSYVDNAIKVYKLEKVWGELVASTNDGKIFAKQARTPIGTVLGNVNREGGRDLLALNDPKYKQKYSDRVFGLQFSGSIRVDDNAATKSIINGKQAVHFTNENVMSINPFGGKSSTLEMTPKELNTILSEITQMSYMNGQQEFPTQMSDNLVQLKFDEFAMKTQMGETLSLKSMPDNKKIAITLDQYLSFVRDHPSEAYAKELPTFYRIFVSQREKYEIKAPQKFNQDQVQYIQKHFTKAYNQHMKPLVNSDGFVDATDRTRLIQSYPDHYTYRAPTAEQVNQYSKKFNIGDTSPFINCNFLMK